MAISSPLTPKTSGRTVKNLQGTLLNKTRVSGQTLSTIKQSYRTVELKMKGELRQKRFLRHQNLQQRVGLQS
jgi:hypothetical protein